VKSLQKKTILLTAVLLAIVAPLSFYAGWQFAPKTTLDYITVSLEWVSGGYAGMIPWYGILDHVS